MKNILKLFLTISLLVFQITLFGPKALSQTCQELFVLQKEEISSVSSVKTDRLSLPESMLQRLGQFFTKHWLVGRERPSDTIVYTGTSYTQGARIAGRSSGDHDLVFVTDIKLALPSNLPQSLRQIFQSNVHAWEIIHYDFEPSTMRVGFGISSPASKIKGHWNAKIQIDLYKIRIMPEEHNDLHYVISNNRVQLSYINERMGAVYELPIGYFQRLIEDLYKMGYRIENFKLKSLPAYGSADS